MKIEILEGNKLIAEFMGERIKNDTQIELGTNLFGLGQKTLHTMEYHLSWDWLMPVVEKIGNYEISRGHCWFWRTNDIGEEKEISNQEADSTIEATWLAVVDFIKWYNQNINQ